MFITSVALLASLIFPTYADITNNLILIAHTENISTVPFVLLAYKESGLNPKAVGDHGLAYGCFQFHKKTFDAFKKEANMPGLEYKDCYDQAKLAAWSFKNGKSNHWTTFNDSLKIEGIEGI